MVPTGAKGAGRLEFISSKSNPPCRFTSFLCSKTSGALEPLVFDADLASWGLMCTGVWGAIISAHIPNKSTKVGIWVVVRALIIV